MQLLGNYVLFLRFLISLIAELIINEYIKIFVPNPIKTTKPDNEVNFCIQSNRYGNETESRILIKRNKRQIKKIDNCLTSTQKDTYEQMPQA